MEKYQVQFTGLKPGTHSFEYRLDRSFFEQYEFNDITGGSVVVKVEMEKEDRMLVFRFDIEGEVGVVCDRCADPLELHLSGEQRLVVKLSDHSGEESEDVQFVKESDGKYDLSQVMYEYVCLMLPASRVHGEDSKGKSLCNPEVLRKLEELNESHTPDPRWEVLNKLKEKK